MALKLSVAVGGFLFVDNNLLIVKRSLHETGDPGIWEQPGGQVEEGEDPEQAIIREFKEETNLDIVVVGALRAYSIVYPKAAPANHLIRIDFIVKLAPDENIKNLKLTEDHDEWKLVARDEFDHIEPTLEHILKSGKMAFEVQNG
jgi:8-oxo-dGTP pyrophosphatase MutT (NUDIX family)